MEHAQRAADGGIAAGQGMEEWASEGELKRDICTAYQLAALYVLSWRQQENRYGIRSRGAGEGTPLTKPAYVSMHERVFS